MATTVKWPHLLQNYFSVTLSPDQQQLWQGELADETNETLCAAIRWAAKNWKRPDYCQINITTMQAWLYKSKNGSQEERVQLEIEYQRKVDGIVADLCRQVDAAPKEGGRVILRTLINGIANEIVRARVAEHASLRGYDWWQDCREQAKQTTGERQ